MFSQVMYTQVKWTRPILAGTSVAAFALPTLLWRLGTEVGWTEISAIQLVAGFAALGPTLAMLAVIGGFLPAAYVWSLDGAAQHVYPLSLPVSWPRFAALRFSAGALTLLVPAIATWLGCLLVLSMIELPPTLRAYPGTVAVRFFLAAVFSYAMTFFLQYLLGKRAVITFGLLIAGLGGFTMLADFLGFTNVLAAIAGFLTEWPGPLAIFSADWALIDV